MATPEELFEKHRAWAWRLASSKAYGQNLRAYCDDLRNSALLGLWQASLRYEPKRGTNFRSYAFAKVIGAMQDALRREDWAPRMARMRGEVKAQMTPLSHFAKPDVSRIMEWNAYQETPLECVLREETAVRAELLLRYFAEGQPREWARLHFIENASAQSISKRWGLSESRVWQIANRAVKDAQRAARLQKQMGAA